MTKDSLGDRMKRAESTTKTQLLGRMPVIIRIDGKAFHTFAKRIMRFDTAMKESDTPFSVVMHKLMVETTRDLVNNIQNCVLGYTQSDEISLLLRDWDTHDTQQWFGGSHQKMVSVSASIATASFNFHATQVGFKQSTFADVAQFDSRVYNLPKEEVTNYFVWRQQDASRNSVQMLGHHHFSQKQMHGKNNSQVQDMLMLEKNINWNDIPTWMKRGTCVVQHLFGDVDEDIPIFTQDRDYIERLLLTPNERLMHPAHLLEQYASTFAVLEAIDAQ